MVCDDQDGKSMPKGTFFLGGQKIKGGGKKLKKNIMRSIVCLLVATVFLMPLMGNTVLGEDEKEVLYYFNSYDRRTEAWETNPENMVDGDIDTFAETTDEGHVQLCDDNTYLGGSPGTITKVELRVWGYYSGDQHDIILQPVFNGSNGDEYSYNTTDDLVFSPWFDITEDNNAPETWTWTDVDTLDCYVKAEDKVTGLSFKLSCSVVQIHVTFEVS